MNHLTDEQLVEHYYKESPQPTRIVHHLRECNGCAAAYDKLRSDLDAIECIAAPARAANHGEQVWQSIRNFVPHTTETANPDAAFQLSESPKLRDGLQPADRPRLLRRTPMGELSAPAANPNSSQQPDPPTDRARGPGRSPRPLRAIPGRTQARRLRRINRIGQRLRRRIFFPPTGFTATAQSNQATPPSPPPSIVSSAS